MKTSILIIGGILVLVLLLAGAAFVGAQLLAVQGQPARTAEGGLTMTTSQGTSVQIQSIRAKELPQTPPDARGVLDHRKDNSLFVSTGPVVSDVQKDQSGHVTSSSSYSGRMVEVVVTPQTIIYSNVTFRQFNGQPPPSGKIHQVVEKGSLDQVGKFTIINAWGKKTGDRVIADVLLYSLPSLGAPRVGG